MITQNMINILDAGEYDISAMQRDYEKGRAEYPSDYFYPELIMQSLLAGRIEQARSQLSRTTFTRGWLLDHGVSRELLSQLDE